MKAYTKEVADIMNAILEKTYDAEQGFLKAAENSKAKSLVIWFTQRAMDRQRFGTQIKWEMGPYVIDVSNNGSVAGGVHRAWIDIKAFVTQDRDEAMLEEAIRGEKAALEEYGAALREQNLPPSAFALLTSQRAHIEYGLALLMRTKALEFERK